MARTTSLQNSQWDNNEDASRKTYDANVEKGIKYGGKWLRANEVAAAIAYKYGLPYTTNRWKAMLTAVVLNVLKVANGDHKGGRKIYSVDDGDEDEKIVVVAVMSGPIGADLAALNEQFNETEIGAKTVRVERARLFCEWLIEYHGFTKFIDRVEHSYTAPGDQEE